MEAKTFALAVFIAAYILFAVLPKYRALAAAAAALLLIVSGVLGPLKAWTLVNWNVMGIFVGMLIVADIFMESRAPARAAELIVDKAKNTRWAVLFICALTSFISAFVENVATVLIVAPIALSLAKKIKINPVNMLIAIAISSNLQGAATLIGDPPSMLLGGFAGMNFADFFFYKGRPSIFFAVQIGALASFFVLYFIFGRNKEKSSIVAVEKIRSWTPTVLLIALIVVLAVTSFMDTGFSYMAGTVCMVFAFFSLLWKKFADKRPLWPAIRSLDWNTAVFLLGIFILVGSLTCTGWIGVISEKLSGIVGANIFLGYILLIAVAVAVSAFVDNVPFLAAMLPVAIDMGLKLNVDPTIFLFGLLIGASLGGNITPIGASANIVACGLLKKEGYDVSFTRFVSIGLPFTLAATVAAAAFTWFVWAK